MKENFEKVGSGFDGDYPMFELVGLPICHLCQHRIWENEERKCVKYDKPPAKYITECDETDCEYLRIDKQVVFYDFFKERVEKGEIKNGLKS